MKSQPVFWVGFFTLAVSLAFSTPSSAEDAPIAQPGKFKVSYTLKKQAPSGALQGAGSYSGASAPTQADVAVNILDARFMPVKTFVLKGVSLQDRVDSLWDGRNVYGKEMPAGPYYAQMSIIYSDGSRDTKIFKFVKE